MKLYTLPASLNSRKLIALVHHLELPVELVAMQPDEVRSESFAAINPNRLAPVLVDGDFTLWESNAIGIYLANDSALVPPSLRQRIDLLRWLHWEGIHLNKALGTLFFETVVRPAFGLGATNQALVEDAAVQAARFLPVLDAHLADRRFLVGDALSFADFAVASAEPYRDRLPIDFDRFPHVQRHFDAIAALPAWQKAVAKPLAAAA